MTTPNEHVHKEVMIKYANDSSLTMQIWNRETERWHDMLSPTFNPAREYRVKPDKNPQTLEAEIAVEKARRVYYAAHIKREIAHGKFEDAKHVLAKLIP